MILKFSFKNLSPPGSTISGSTLARTISMKRLSEDDGAWGDSISQSRRNRSCYGWSNSNRRCVGPMARYKGSCRKFNNIYQRDLKKQKEVNGRLNYPTKNDHYITISILFVKMVVMTLTYWGTVLNLFLLTTKISIHFADCHLLVTKLIMSHQLQSPIVNVP